MMGFTMWLGMVYIGLMGLAATAFIKKKRGIGMILSAIMVTGILALGWLWVTSPM